MNERKTSPSATTARRTGRHWTWSVLIGAAILVCGIIIGVCLTLIVVRNRVIELIQHPEKRTEAMVARLDRALDLRDEQRAEIRDILQRHRSEFNEIRREVGPRVKNQIEALDRDISEVLTDEQRQKWDRYLKRLRRLWTPRFRRRGRGKEGAEG
jgi:septal ring factor EnvC (AmiA/AmiB activator)